MVKIREILEAIAQVDKKITAEVKKGTGRDKHAIRRLQEEHRGLTFRLSKLTKEDGETPKDDTDKSGVEFKEEKRKARTKKKEEEIRKSAEEMAKKETTTKKTPT